MKDINDQPQELLARYADRTRCRAEYCHISNGKPNEKWFAVTLKEQLIHAPFASVKIRLVLDPVTRLPSHLKPYKENPRDPGEGYRVPTAGDVVTKELEYNVSAFCWGAYLDHGFSKFKGYGTYVNHYRLPATVMPPDWEEMTKEVVQPDPKAWIPHTGDVMPCDGERLVEVKLIHPYTAHPAKFGKLWSWNSTLCATITHWRYADAAPEEDAILVPKWIHEALDKAGAPTHHSIKPGCAMPKPMMPCERIAWLGDKAKDQNPVWKSIADEAGLILDEVRRQLGGIDCVALEDIVSVLKEKIQAPTLRPISEMPADVPDGCVRHWFEFRDGIIMNNLTNYKGIRDTHFVDLQLPAPPDALAEERAAFEAWWDSQSVKAGKHKAESFEV